MSPIPANAAIAKHVELGGHVPWPDASDHWPVTLMPRVEQCTQVLVALGLLLRPEYRVPLVDDQRRRVLAVEGPEDRRRRGIDGHQRHMAQPGNDIQQPRLPATLLWAFQDQPRRAVEGWQHVGRRVPLLGLTADLRSLSAGD
jgi:hypothetical protein